MNKTELVSDTLEDIAREAARKLVFDEPMSVNDWDALQSLASFRLLEIDLQEQVE